VAGDSSDLTIQQQDAVVKEAAEAGEPIPEMRFGAFAADEERGLERITRTAKQDFKFLKSLTPGRIKQWHELQRTVEGRAQWERKMEALRPAMKWDDDIREEFGRWVAAYVERAGYVSPRLMPRVCKVVVMTAFPSLPYSDLPTPAERWEAYAAGPVPLWLMVDAWMAGFIKLEQYTKSEFECYSRIRTSQFMIAGLG